MVSFQVFESASSIVWISLESVGCTPKGKKHKLLVLVRPGFGNPRTSLPLHSTEEGRHKKANPGLRGDELNSTPSVGGEAKDVQPS